MLPCEEYRLCEAGLGGLERRLGDIGGPRCSLLGVEGLEPAELTEHTEEGRDLRPPAL